jgi:hypothetical protein
VDELPANFTESMNRHEQIPDFALTFQEVCGYALFRFIAPGLTTEQCFS